MRRRGEAQIGQRARLRRLRQAGHSLTALQPEDSPADAGDMRNVLLNGVTLIFEAIVVVGCLGMAIAARTALAVAPWQ